MFICYMAVVKSGVTTSYSVFEYSTVLIELEEMFFLYSCSVSRLRSPWKKNFSVSTRTKVTMPAVIRWSRRSRHQDPTCGLAQLRSWDTLELERDVEQCLGQAGLTEEVANCRRHEAAAVHHSSVS